MAPAEQFFYSHPELGRLIGLVRREHVVQFRGIPYAQIPGRFRQSVRMSSLPQEPFDGTRTGPMCPQETMEYPQYWDGPVRSDDVALGKPVMDEFGCLNLNISVPRVVLESKQAPQLPVFVFIHGGGLVGGSHSVQVCGREVYDGTDLVNYSLSQKKPVVYVSLNYRIGPLGFLASRQLEWFNKAHHEPVGNYGLHDQRQALEWISRFISGFGGDPENVTIQGSSAGGASCHYQSLFPERKFRRAILASGTAMAIVPLEIKDHQPLFDKFVERLAVSPDTGKLGDVSRDDGYRIVQDLQSIPVMKFVNCCQVIPYRLLIDGEWIPGSTVELVKHREELPDLIIGSCSYEEELVRGLLSNPTGGKTDTNESITERSNELTRAIPLAESAELFSSYPSVPRPDLPDHSFANPDPSPELFDRYASFITEVMFRIPPYHVAIPSNLQRSQRNFLIYEFKATNPYPRWPSSYKRANHAANDIFLFNIAPDLVPEMHRLEFSGAVKQLRDSWLDFCYGKLPWGRIEITNGQVGPIFTYENEGRGGVCNTLEDAVGHTTALRWRNVLKPNEN